MKKIISTSLKKRGSVEDVIHSMAETIISLDVMLRDRTRLIEGIDKKVSLLDEVVRGNGQVGVRAELNTLKSKVEDLKGEVVLSIQDRHEQQKSLAEHRWTLWSAIGVSIISAILSFILRR